MAGCHYADFIIKDNFFRETPCSRDHRLVDVSQREAVKKRKVSIQTAKKMLKKILKYKILSWGQIKSD